MPDGFAIQKNVPIPYCTTIKNKNFLIQIFDHSGLGYEADIDTFLERKKRGVSENDTDLFFLRGQKKCLVQSDQTPINFSMCKKITIRLVFREKCYGIIMENDEYFDLCKYSKFLESIGDNRYTKLLKKKVGKK
ncbi:MAG: hypothetical protein LBP59_19565 [Planctomycetaceae bacterium]|nr:hypothetical protein [Planctomycetaceae bacterium]